MQRIVLNLETAKVGTLAVRKIAMGKIAGKMLDVIIIILKQCSCDVICLVFQNMKIYEKIHKYIQI